MIHQGLGIAVIAARRDMLAPNPRVERVIAPFNFAVFTHDTTCSKVGSQIKIDAINCSFTSANFRTVQARIISPESSGYLKALASWANGVAFEI